MSVRFGLLGDISAEIDGRAAELGHARQRCVLAALLADANHSVSTDQLAERVWADQLPYQAHRSLASYLSRLRRSLAGTGEVEILRAGSGYVIKVDPDAVDLHRFRALVGQARARQDLGLFDRALELWRGDAFAGVDTPWCDGMRQTLNAERLAAELDRTDLALSLGEHNTVLSEASVRAAAHPFDERVAGQLMLALCRAGRQADALDHYRQMRRRLAEEFGADPGGALRELHQRILTADCEFEPVKEAAVPRQLPAPPRWLVGRDRELAALNEPTMVSAIGGAGGVGKSTLALRWAHNNVDRFPDGQLYLNLRGFDPSDTPMPPMVAVRHLLGALGVAPAALPADEEGQVTLYRSLVAGRRLLVMLDNARDTAQVEHLLPGSETCTVLITSRNHLAGLGVRGARLLDLGMLAETGARDLLTCHLGAFRVAEEPEAVAGLVRWCAGLPLAVSIVAARASAQPGFPLAALAKELQDASARLDALDAADLNVNLRAVFSWSYRALDPEPARVFALLGAIPGPDIGLPALVALTGLSSPRVRAVLRVLVAAHLVEEHVPGRYRMHDLLRLYANELLDEGAQATAVRRLTDFYLHTAHGAAYLIRPEHGLIGLPPGPQTFDHRAAATLWFDTEISCLVAVLTSGAHRGWHTSVWQLAWALSAFRVMRGYLVDDLEAWRTAVSSAEKLDDPVTLAVARMYLGTALARVGSYTEALDHLCEARTLAEHAVPVLADVHRTLGWIWEQQGDLTLALPHTHRALQLYRTTGNRMREADALNSAGWLHAQLGQHQRAATYCEQALVLCRRHNHPRGEAITLDSLGYIARQLGRHDEALAYYSEALALVRATDNTYDEAVIQANLGDACHALGRHAEARQAWQQARDLCLAQHRARAAEDLRRKLAQDCLYLSTPCTPPCR